MNCLDHEFARHPRHASAWAWAAIHAEDRYGFWGERVVHALGHSSAVLDLASPALWPNTPRLVDAFHIKWCREVLSNVPRGGANYGYGAVASVLAVYVRGIIQGSAAASQQSSDFEMLAHPPLDRGLLKAVLRGYRGEDMTRAWAKPPHRLAEQNYFAIINGLRWRHALSRRGELAWLEQFRDELN